MKLNLSPQARSIALVALVAFLGVAVAVFTLGRAQRSGEETARPVAPVKSPAPAQRGRAAQAPGGAPAVTPSRPRVNPAVARALSSGLPPVVAAAFERNQAVVVELYSPESDLDQLALQEAAAGAGVAGAGFVQIDVSSEADESTRALVTSLEVLSAPTLLVFKRPGTLVVRINGFADQETVAQAARNAAS